MLQLKLPVRNRVLASLALLVLVHLLARRLNRFEDGQLFLLLFGVCLLSGSGLVRLIFGSCVRSRGGIGLLCVSRLQVCFRLACLLCCWRCACICHCGLKG